MRTTIIFIALILMFCRMSIDAFTPQSSSSSKPTKCTSTVLFAAKSEDPTCSRRQAVLGVAAFVAAATSNANPVAAKPDPQEADKQKLVEGYKRLNYLVDNWEQETTNCKTKTQYSSASNACERTPLNVQNYLGYRSTEDPLFRADKTMRRLEGLVPPDLEVEYLDAMEKFNEKAEEGSGNSYTSSWGEANPGGGKDRVELFVERAKVNVVDARDALGEIVKILGLI